MTTPTQAEQFHAGNSHNPDALYDATCGLDILMDYGDIAVDRKIFGAADNALIYFCLEWNLYDYEIDENSDGKFVKLFFTDGSTYTQYA